MWVYFGVQVLREWQGEVMARGGKAGPKSQNDPCGRKGLFSFSKSDEPDGSEPEHRKSQREAGAGIPVDEGGPSYLWQTGKETATLRAGGTQWTLNEPYSVHHQLTRSETCDVLLSVALFSGGLSLRGSVL